MYILEFWLFLSHNSKLSSHNLDLFSEKIKSWNGDKLAKKIRNKLLFFYYYSEVETGFLTLPLRFENNHFSLVHFNNDSSQRVLIGIGTNVTRRVGTQHGFQSSPRMSWWISKCFYWRAQEDFSKQTLQMVENTVILNYPSVLRRNFMIWCYGSSGDLHLLQPNNAQNVTTEALKNLSRGAERLGNTFKLSSNPLP